MDKDDIREQETDPKIQTINYYDQKASEWSSTHGGEDKESWWEQEMIRFNEFLPSGRIIEIGAGVGKDAEALIAMGYNYLGTDASIGLLEIAKRRNPNATFIQKYVHELEPSIGEFDGFWASAVLLHIPREEIPESLTAISSVIREGGIGFITLKEGDDEKIDEETGRLYTYFREDEFRKVLKEAGFKTLEVRMRNTSKDNWLIFYTQKT